MKNTLLTLCCILFYVVLSFAQQTDLEAIKTFKEQGWSSSFDTNYFHAKPGASTRDFDAYGDPPDWDWVQHFGGDGLDRVNAFIEASDGSFYITGSYSGTISVAGESFTSEGGQDMFLAKIASNGDLLWLKEYAASDRDDLVPLSMDQDAGGNIYISGYFTGTTSAFGTTLSIAGTDNVRAAFLVKLDAAANVIWARQYDDNWNAQSGKKIKLLNNNQLIMITQYSTGSTLGFLAKFNTDGQLLWDDPDRRLFEDLDFIDNKLYLNGTFYNDTDFGNTTLTFTGFYENSFIAKADTDLSYDWARSVATTNGDNRAKAVIVAGNACYISGRFRQDVILGTITSPGYAYGLYFSKLDLNGNFLWASFADISAASSPAFLSLDANGNLLAAGHFSVNMDLDDGTNISSDKESYWLVLDENDGSFLQSTTLDGETIALGLNSDNNMRAGDQFGDLMFQHFTPNSEVIDWEIISEGTSGYASVFNEAWMGINALGQTIFTGTYRYDFPVENTVLFSRFNAAAIIKVGVNGEVVWAKSLQAEGGSVNIETGFMETNGAMLVGGTFSGTISTSLGDFTGDNSSFIARYSNSGNLISFVAFSNTFMYNLQVDNEGSVLVSGTFNGDLAIGAETIQTSGTPDGFLAKLDNDLNLLWLQRIGGDDYEYLTLVQADALGNYYVALEYTSTDLTVGSIAMTLEDGEGNIVLIKFDNDGNALWAKAYGGATDPNSINDYYSWPVAIKINDDGDIFMVGNIGPDNDFGGISLVNPNWQGSLTHRINWFISKLDADGNVLWVHGVNHERFAYASFQIDDDEQGNLYLGGEFRGLTTFLDGALEIMPDVEGQRNGLLAKYDSDGALEWLNTMEGNAVRVAGLAVREEDKLIISGDFATYINLSNSLSLENQSNNLFVASTGDFPVSVQYLHPDHYSLEVSPNPFTTDFQISFGLEKAETVQLSMYDIQGKLLQSFSPVALGQNIKHTINVSPDTSLPAGMYFVQLRMGDVLTVVKVEKL